MIILLQPDQDHRDPIRIPAPLSVVLADTALRDRGVIPTNTSPIEKEIEHHNGSLQIRQLKRLTRPHIGQSEVIRLIPDKPRLRLHPHREKHQGQQNEQKKPRIGSSPKNFSGRSPSKLKAFGEIHD